MNVQEISIVIVTSNAYAAEIKTELNEHLKEMILTRPFGLIIGEPRNLRKKTAIILGEEEILKIEDS